jgi:3',5'-cyclic AMP phosphodiesterase CpdA
MMLFRIQFTVGITVLLLASLTSCPRSWLPGVPSQLPDGPKPGEEHWLRFVHITDPQICDEESPARAVMFDHIIPVSWRPQENYGVHTLDATLQAINRRHEAGLAEGRPVDFVVITGDLADGALHNELRWFLDTMDGQWVAPDSGDPDGELRNQPAEDNPKLGFQPEGLHRDIPWYTVFGNHDELAVGTFGVDRGTLDPELWTAPLLWPSAVFLGLSLLTPPQTGLVPVFDQSPAILRGSEEVLDPITLQLPLHRLRYGPIVPDPRRRFLSRRQFIEEHFHTQGLPAGHGFTEENRASGQVTYSVLPKPGIPVRLIVMDTVATNPPMGFPVEYGVMPRRQFERFVLAEIERAHAAGEYVVLASHHPSSNFDRLFPAVTVGTVEFRERVAAWPNVVAHLCGHSHRHRVTTIEGAYSYLEIETGAIIDYPQEGRIFDLYFDPQTDTLRLTGTLFSHMESPTRLSAESFRRAWIDALFWGGTDSTHHGWEDLFPDPKDVFGSEVRLEKARAPEQPTMHERHGTACDRIIDVRRQGFWESTR